MRPSAKRWQSLGTISRFESNEELFAQDATCLGCQWNSCSMENLSNYWEFKGSSEPEFWGWTQTLWRKKNHLCFSLRQHKSYFYLTLSFMSLRPLTSPRERTGLYFPFVWFKIFHERFEGEEKTAVICHLKKQFWTQDFVPFSLELKGQKHTNSLGENARTRAHTHTLTHNELSFEESRHLAVEYLWPSFIVRCWKAEATRSWLSSNLIGLQRRTARHWLNLRGSTGATGATRFGAAAFSFAIITHSHELHSYDWHLSENVFILGPCGNVKVNKAKTKTALIPIWIQKAWKWWRLEHCSDCLLIPNSTFLLLTINSICTH